MNWNIFKNSYRLADFLKSKYFWCNQNIVEQKFGWVMIMTVSLGSNNTKKPYGFLHEGFTLSGAGRT